MARLIHAVDAAMQSFMTNLEDARKNTEPEMSKDEFFHFLAAYWDQGRTVDGWYARWYLEDGIG
jgi:hypothetical protein